MRSRLPWSIEARQVRRARNLLARHLDAISTEDCGRGREPERGDTERDDAMAWSLYTRGFAWLARSPRRRAHADAFANCVDRLLASSSPVGPDRRAWGLPYAWKEQAAHHPYGITTAMCGDALLDARDAGARVDDGVLNETGAWLARDLAWHERADGQSGCPEFSPGMTYLATNVAARTAGFLLALTAAGMGDDTVRRRGLQALRYTLDEMQEEGGWFYGRHDLGTASKPKIDNIHTAYVLEGLARARQAGAAVLGESLVERTSEAITRGFRFYAAHLFHYGRGRERVFRVPGDRVTAWDKRRPSWEQEPLEGSEVLFVDPLETRSWAVGAGLTACVALGGSEPGVVSLVDALLGMAERLEFRPGRFGYRSDDPVPYVRHEAHLCFGLCGVVGGRFGVQGRSSIQK